MGHFPAGGGGGGSGTITDITSVDHTVTIVDPTGPTTDLSVPGASGTVTAVDSPDNSLAVTSGTTTPHLRGGVPAGDRTKIATPIAFTDPISGDAIQVLTFSEETTAMALAVTGDAFPRLVVFPAASDGNPYLSLGDGTYDPLTGLNAFQILNDGGVWSIFGNDQGLEFDNTYGHVTGAIIAAGTHLLTFEPITVHMLTGNPNTLTEPGNINDLAINSAATGDNDWLWRCSVAGAAGIAVWVGKL